MKNKMVLIPQALHIDGNVVHHIKLILGSEDQQTDGTLWVGELVDDDGKPVHGLHLCSAEYPDEGSITLAEFPAPEDHQEAT